MSEKKALSMLCRLGNSSFSSIFRVRTVLPPLALPLTVLELRHHVLGDGRAVPHLVQSELVVPAELECVALEVDARHEGLQSRIQRDAPPAALVRVGGHALRDRDVVEAVSVEEVDLA
jgi:hypothetical protein